jgi:hypothetical protein
MRASTRRFAPVPVTRYFAVAGPTARARNVAAIAAVRDASAMRTSPRPRTTIALSCFAPITAPLPPRPAWRPSLSSVAKATRRSPAGPIAQTRAVRSPSDSRSRFVVSRALAPSNGEASSNRTPLPSITSVVQRRAVPRTTIAARPQRRSTADQWLDESPSFSNPVSGEIVATACLLAAGTGVDANGPAAKTSGLAGPSGSIGPSMSASSSQTARPTPPSAAANTASSRSRRTADSRPRSTSSTVRGPAYVIRRSVRRARTDDRPR